jgi:hypothetical protein
MENFDDLKKQLSELAAVLNEFKSEAVQLRILDFVLRRETEQIDRMNESDEPSHKPKRKHRSPGTGTGAGAELKAPPPERKRRGAVGTGAPATLVQLLSDNFFDQPRTINDLIEHCKHNLARTFKANEFSGKLGRMVRKGELTRKKNAEKQYEYKKP